MGFKCGFPFGLQRSEGCKRIARHLHLSDYAEASRSFHNRSSLRNHLAKGIRLGLEHHRANHSQSRRNLAANAGRGYDTLCDACKPHRTNRCGA
jgi:hypothetical protein